MAGPVKTVCFIASVVIAWGLFEVGEAIVAWFYFKIRGIEIPGNLELADQDKIEHMISILIHGLLLHGIRKKTSKFMFPWMFLYYIFILVGLIPIAMLGIRLFINCFFADHFEISRVDYKWISIYSTVYIYKTWVEEIYKSIKKREEAIEKNELMKRRMAENAKIEEGKKTKEDEKTNNSEKEPGMMA